MTRPSVWRRSGPEMGVPGEWLTISPPTRFARPTSRTARTDTFRSMSLGMWLRVSDQGKPTSRFAALWAQRTGPDDDARMVLASSAAELTKVQEQLKKAGLVPLTLHAWRQADDNLSYSGVWHKTADRYRRLPASSQSGLSEAELPDMIRSASWLPDRP